MFRSSYRSRASNCGAQRSASPAFWASCQLGNTPPIPALAWRESRQASAFITFTFGDRSFTYGVRFIR